jgi:hypothetical protein
MNTHDVTKRLQVLVEDGELVEIQQAARRQRQSVAEWVRVALRAARATDAGRPAADKLRALHAGTLHAFPTGSIEEMLADIERGYGTSR